MASSPNDLTVLFIPGAWHTPDCFDAVARGLKWPTQGVELATVGGAHTGLADDVAVARAALQRLADAGRRVVVVAHSYGGLVAADAVKGLEGSVLLLVYLAAFVAPAGSGSVYGMLGGAWLPWMRVEDDYITVDTPEAVFYHDVAEAEAGAAARRMQRHAKQAFLDAPTNEPWTAAGGGVACMYVFCDDDRALPLAVQEQLAGALGPAALRYHCPTSHSPFLSRPADVVRALEYGVEACVQRG